MRWSSLHEAASVGDLKTVQRLLETGSVASVRAIDGSTPLIATTSFEVIQALLAAGARPQEASEDGWNALTAAALRGDAPSLKALYSAGALADQSQAALFLYIRLGARLIERGDRDSRREEWLGQDPNTPDRFVCEVDAHVPEDTPVQLLSYIHTEGPILRVGHLEFHPASSRPGLAQMAYHLPIPRPVAYAQRLAKFLESNGPLGDLLELACRRGDANIVSALIPRTDPAQWSLALIWAAAYGKLALLPLLVKAGVNPSIALVAGAGCLSDGEKVVSRLLKLGADPDQSDGIGQTALMVAADRRKADLLKRLLKAGANPNRLDQRGRNALHYALDFGRPKCVEELIRAGTFINQADHQGITPLHMAIASPLVETELIQTLLRAGANPHLPDHQGQTPAGLANLQHRPYIDLLAG